MDFRSDNILFFGYGNTTRCDDGLGWLFVERLGEWVRENGITNIQTHYAFQLNIDAADEISKYDSVVFVDATKEEIDSFKLSPVSVSKYSEYSSHTVSPEYVVTLCEELYGKHPEVFLLQIKGYEWDFVEQLSIQAERNLLKALDLIKQKT